MSGSRNYNNAPGGTYTGGKPQGVRAHEARARGIGLKNIDFHRVVPLTLLGEFIKTHTLPGTLSAA